MSEQCEICGNDYGISREVEVTDIQDKELRVKWKLCNSCWKETFSETEKRF